MAVQAMRVSYRCLRSSSTVKSSRAILPAQVASCEGCCDSQFYSSIFASEAPEGLGATLMIPCVTACRRLSGPSDTSRIELILVVVVVFARTHPVTFHGVEEAIFGHLGKSPYEFTGRGC